MLWILVWLLTLSTHDQSASEVTDWMKPRTWTGNFWGPKAYRARLTGELPPLPLSPELDQWKQWGIKTLRDGDILFRLGDARALRGTFPLSQFIARATGSPFSHTGLVATEKEGVFVYDCSSSGLQRQPFEIWMLDNVGSFGVKRLQLEHRSKIPGVLAFCREAFEREVPFDFGFRLDDDAFYCVELVEKSFRSQGLALSEPVRIGDWEHLVEFPITALAIPFSTGLVLSRPITLEQPVFVPGNDHEGIWACPLLETVFSNHKEFGPANSVGRNGGLSLKGDFTLIVSVAAELHRSYTEFPMRLLQEVVLRVHRPETVASRGTESGRARRHSMQVIPAM